MDNVKNETAREAYEAPTIEDMPLRPEEQLLAGCKQANFQPSPTSGQALCFVCFSVQAS